MSPRTDEEPRPRARIRPYEPHAWRVLRTLRLGNPVPPPEAGFSEILGARRSARRMVRAPLRETGNWLGFVQAIRHTTATEPVLRTRRLSASAGGLHPIDLVLATAAGRPRAFRFDPQAGALQQLAPADEAGLRRELAAARAICPGADADIVVLVADAAKTRAAYERSSSLLWRDAGCLLQTLHLCATAFRLSFCPLGIEGRALLRSIAGDDPLRPAGVGLIGRPPQL